MEGMWHDYEWSCHGYIWVVANLVPFWVLVSAFRAWRLYFNYFASRYFMSHIGVLDEVHLFFHYFQVILKKKIIFSFTDRTFGCAVSATLAPTALRPASCLSSASVRGCLVVLLLNLIVFRTLSLDCC